MKNCIPVIAFFLCFHAGCAIDSCGGSASGLVKKMDALIGKVENDKANYSTTYWKVKDEEYGHLMDGCFEQYEAKMTSVQKRNFWRGSRKYLKLRIGSSLNRLFRHAGDQSLGSDLEALISKTTEAISKMSDDAEGKEMQSAWQEDLKSWKKK